MRLACCLTVAAACLAAGCVERRMTVRSNVHGAMVVVDDARGANRFIGYTPVSESFVYYGTPRITLVADGYETLTVDQPVPTPWYDIFPLDFVTENLIPFTIRDEREFYYTMQPQQVLSTEQLMQRAEGLRYETQVGIE